MKRIAVPMILALLLAGSAFAADLQAGWYVHIYPIQFYTYAPGVGPQLMGPVRFTTPSSSYGPFVLTDNGHPGNEARATVPVDAPDVSASDSLVLPLFASISPDDAIYTTYIGCETNYDSSQMRLEFWHSRSNGTADLVWYQGLSGQQNAFPEISRYMTYENGFFFNVAVVPEPSSGLAAMLGLSGLLVCVRRRTI